MSLGAIGHHLPGMLRAYGDRALFRRFRARFVLAPILLAGACVLFSTRGLHGLVLIAFLWGIWHGMMQTYGFARIYGAREGAGDRTTARTDLALLATWFAAGVVFSPLRMVFVLDFAAQCGMPLPSASVLRAFELFVGAATAVATLAWVVHFARTRRLGRPTGDLRLLLLGTSIAFWCFANIRVRHPLLGMPLFELFHDAQYLTIVWVFNRKRADSGAEISTLLERLFAPSRTALFVYVAAVAAYGALALWQPGGVLSEALTGVLAASQLLHFYYDGFIWKVRERETGAALGVSSTGPAPKTVGALRHAAVWALLVVPAGAFAAGEMRGDVTLDERVLAVAELQPQSALTSFSAAEIHWKHGERRRAMAEYRRALDSDPDYAPARRNLALSIGVLADEAKASSNDRELRALADELGRMRPTLHGDMATWADEKLDEWDHGDGWSSGLP
jgi:hypothetical protein